MLHLGQRVADNTPFELELDQAVERQLAIMATKGGGKTYAGSVLAEEVLEARVQVCVLDPTGVWWGLRSGVGPAARGYAIIILGGDHGDLPLEPTAGAVVADAVADGLSCILDLSHFASAGEQRRFATDFAERLYRGKSQRRSTLLLEIDEADEFAPQRTLAEGARMQRAFEVLVKRGRTRGIWVALISQRPASVHKDVLSQCHALLALPTIGKHDRKALDDWVDVQGTPEQRAALATSIAELPRGTGWWCSPQDHIFTRVAIRQRYTFDSSATPRPGERLPEPGNRATVDLDQLRERMAATIEHAKQDDPRELRRRIIDLEQRLADRAPVEVPVEVLVEKPVLTEENRRELELLREAIATTVTALNGFCERLVTNMAPLDVLLSPLRSGAPAARWAHNPEVRGSIPRAATTTPTPSAPRRPSAPEQNGHLPKGEQAIVDALYWWLSLGIASPTRLQVGMVAGYRADTGHFGNMLTALRKRELVTQDAGHLALTKAGARVAEPVPLATTDEALQAAVLERLGGPERKVLHALIQAYPDWLDRGHLGDETGYRADTGHFGNILTRLSGMQLIERETGRIRAAPVLFPSAVQ